MFNNPRIRLAAAFLAPAFVGLFLFVSGVAPSFSESAHSTASSGSKSLFQANCAICHDADGAGSALGKNLHAPDLRSQQVQKQSNAALAKFIHDGRGAMPPFGSKLDSAQINSLVKYVRHLAAAKR